MTSFRPVSVFIHSNDLKRHDFMITKTIFDVSCPCSSLADVAGSFTTPSNGRLEKGTSELVYTPNEDFCGTDSFNYTLSNQDFSDTATVFIDVICSPEEGEVPQTTGATELAFTDESPPGSLVLMDDFAEGNMDEELSIPILSNDIIPYGE